MLHCQIAEDLCILESPQYQDIESINAENERCTFTCVRSCKAVSRGAQRHQLWAVTSAGTEAGTEEEVISAVRLRRPETAQWGRDEEHMVWWEGVTVVLKSKKYNEK